MDKEEKNFQLFLNAYFEAMFFTEKEQLQENSCNHWELSQQAKTVSHDDCKKFYSKVCHLELNPEQLGHDFWMTRNRHGVGFWDGDYSEKNETILMDAVSEFKEVYVYPNDYGFLSIE